MIAIPAAIALWLAASPARGYIVAQYDTMTGHYEVQSFGLPAEWRPIYARILKNKYGVQHRVVAGCEVTPWLVGYVRAYNQVSKEKINRKYGRDIFKECAALAEAEYGKIKTETNQ